MRPYRKQLVEAGQASHLNLSRPIIKLIISEFKPGLKILDVGCGLGRQMDYIKTSLPNYFSWIEGIDWSPSTVDYHSRDSLAVYQNVELCKSDKLPYEDQSFDVCLSMENLEHLYGQAPIDALREMQRVAKHIILTTPLPEHVVNFDFLHQEIKAAVDDPLPLSKREFICLESAVHKSVLLPKSMIAAGFRRFGGPSHSHFFGKSDCLCLDKVHCVGISDRSDRSHEHTLLIGSCETDYRFRYLILLADSIGLDAQIAPFKEFGFLRICTAVSSRLLHSVKSCILARSPKLVTYLKKLFGGRLS